MVQLHQRTVGFCMLLQCQEPLPPQFHMHVLSQDANPEPRRILPMKSDQPKVKDPPTGDKQQKMAKHLWLCTWLL